MSTSQHNFSSFDPNAQPRPKSNETQTTNDSPHGSGSPSTQMTSSTLIPPDQTVSAHNSPPLNSSTLSRHNSHVDRPKLRAALSQMELSSFKAAPAPLKTFTVDQSDLPPAPPQFRHYHNLQAKLSRSHFDGFLP